MIFVYYSLCKNDQESRHVTAWRLLAYSLEKHFGIKLQELEVLRSTEGKPYFKSRKDIRFSLSHSGEYAVCAIGGSGENVGADIEQIKPVSERLMKKYLGGVFDDAEAITRWTRLESYGKLTGDGFCAKLGDAEKSGIGFASYRIGDYILTAASENIKGNDSVCFTELTGTDF